MLADGARSIEVFSMGRWRKGVYQPGSIGMTPPHQSDRLKWSPGRGGGPVRLVDLYIPQRNFDEAYQEYRRAGQPYQSAPLNALSFSDAAVAQVMLALVRAVQSGAPDLYAESAIGWLARHLLAAGNRWFDPDTDDRNVGVITDRRIARVIEYMTAHACDPLCLDDLADTAGVSKFHFSRLFRTKTGFTPAAFLTNLRMQLARRLLTTTDLRVKEVASACGYTSHAAFNAAFRRWNSQPPRAFRKAEFL
jgi:AraC family transcriptional regulator